MEYLLLKVVGYTAVALVLLRLAVVALAIPLAWGAGVYMAVRAVAAKARTAPHV